MKILFYTSFNTRSRDTESLMEGFIQGGHSVYLLTQKGKGAYHNFSEKFGVKSFGFDVKRRPIFFYLFIHWFFLISFCWRHQIDIVYAHLEEPGLIAALSQYFIRAKIVVCRHIIDEAYLFNNKNFILLNKIVYKLARHIVVVSHRAKQFMVETEKVESSKIYNIPLGYNFSFYSPFNAEIVRNIKTEFAADLLIITACRLVPAKRPMLSILSVQQLVKKNVNAKLLILGQGYQKEELLHYIIANNLSDNVFILGFKYNIIDYLAAADVLLHPSILDSSSVIIKEAGLLQKVVIACKSVGDVDDYLIHGKNALMADKENPINDMVNNLMDIAKNLHPEERKILGRNLNKEILKRFNVGNALTLYNDLQQKLLN